VNTTHHSNETDASIPQSIVWMDAYEAEGEWYGTDYTAEKRLMTTIGYVIAKTNDYWSVASTYDPDMEQYACVINIPIGMVVTATPILEVFGLVEADSADTETPHQHSQHPWQQQG
jgi:hypothetical protein